MAQTLYLEDSCPALKQGAKVKTANMAALTRGSILVGGASDAVSALAAKTAGQILVGDGTDIASVAVSGDATLSSAGALTVAPGAVTPGKLSAAGNSRVVSVPLGAVAATTSFIAFVAPVAGSLNKCYLVTKDAIAANDTDYWTVSLVDKGAAGAGIDAIATKDTKATGGTAFAAYTAWDIGTLSATHKVLAAGDVVLLTLTKAGAATAFAEAVCVLEFLPS